MEILIKYEKYHINKKLETITGDGNRFFYLREENTHCVFSAIGLENPETVKMYTYLIGCFPVTSNRVMQSILILHEYDTNSILVGAIKTRSDTYMLRAYGVLYNTL